MNRVPPFEDFKSVLISKLTADERGSSVLYAVSTAVPAGSQLKFPGIAISIPWEAYLGFLDRQPLANWGHSARYIIVNKRNGETLSYETRLPPFQRGSELVWSVIYKAASVPDTAIHKP